MLLTQTVKVEDNVNLKELAYSSIPKDCHCEKTIVIKDDERDDAKPTDTSYTDADGEAISVCRSDQTP